MSLLLVTSLRSLVINYYGWERFSKFGGLFLNMVMTSMHETLEIQGPAIIASKRFSLSMKGLFHCFVTVLPINSALSDPILKSPI